MTHNDMLWVTTLHVHIMQSCHAARHPIMNLHMLYFATGIDPPSGNKFNIVLLSQYIVRVKKSV